MYSDINIIMDMLDWNNSIEVQEEGRKLAESVQNLKIFVQPIDKRYNKNVWENCALVLNKKNDELLSPYLFELLEWLRDLNWPGAIIILDRLKLFKNYQSLAKVLTESILMAKEKNDDIWMMNLAELVYIENINMYIQQDIKDLLSAVEN